VNRSAPAIATARIVLINTRVIFIFISSFCRSFACPLQPSNGGLRGLHSRSSSYGPLASFSPPLPYVLLLN
jgi:hypothetical protein